MKLQFGYFYLQLSYDVFGQNKEALISTLAVFN